MKHSGKVIILSVISAVAFTAYSSTKDIRAESYRMLNMFTLVLEQVHNDYVEEKSYSELITSAIKGMLKDLDPHSQFLVEKDFERLEESTTGKFGGLGIHILPDTKTNTVKIVAPIDDTPAQRAGLESGDLIIEIDGEYVEQMEFEDAIKKMRGEPNTDVTLKIIRKGEQPFDVTLTRAIIKVPSVKAELKDNGIAYIKLVQFQTNMTKDLKAKIKKLKSKSKTPIRGYVIDLRNNPGGLLSEAINISDSFLTQGEIVSTRGRHENQNQRYNATPDDITNGAPIVVIVNRGSASASEIVAGALKDHKRAIIVGEKTFGKGSVQSIVQLEEKVAVKFTTSLYYTPNGISIQKVGIVPDIQITPVKITEEFERGNFGEGQFSKALDNKQNISKNKNSKPKDQKKDSKKDTKQKKSLNKTDYVLARAIDVLETMIWTDNKDK